MVANIKRKVLVSAAALAVAGAPVVLQAQTDPADPNAEANAEKARLEAETGLVNAQTARINAEAARDRTRIESLKLPSFEGRTTLGEGVGSMEAAMLSNHAVHAAAATIGTQVRSASADNRPVVVLAGDEALDFSRISAIDTEITAIDRVFDQVLAQDARAAAATRARGSRGVRGSGEAGGSLSLATAVSAISAIAGLLRSNTEVTAVDLPIISNRLLATAVASNIANAVVPSAAVGPLDTNAGLLRRLIDLTDKRAQVQAARDAIRVADPAKPTDAEKARIAPLAAALTRFDTFAARVTTADANGVVPIVQADRLSALWARQPRVLRVYVEKAGGSLVNRTNLGTTLGFADPIRVSGGMVASFVFTDPTSGVVARAGTITCRTTLSRLSWVQRGDWGDRERRRAEGSECSPGTVAETAPTGSGRRTR